MTKYLFSSLLLSVFLLSCGNETNTNSNTNNATTKTDTVAKIINNTKSSKYNFTYNIEQPTSEFELSKVLKEISGLACYQDKWLLAVQDEKGLIFVLDKNSGEVIDDIKFAKKGDFEGLACVGDTVYVLEANGTLFQIVNWENKKKSKGQSIPTGLSVRNDTEGLDYDASTNSLLIACKGSSAIDQDEHSSRSVFSYDLKSNQLTSSPILNISIDKIKKFAQENIGSNPDLEIYMDGMEKKDKSISIAPSSVAVHPITKDFYVLSATGKSLIVMSRNNEILHIARLTKEFEQPEGLAFSSNGDLFIATEGQKKKAKLYKFVSI